MYFNYKTQVKEKARQNYVINTTYIYLSVKGEEKETPEDMS